MSNELPILTDKEARVLGCLLEKQLATPEYYPLTLNALTNACNQKSNRDPVVSYTEETVVRALDGLRDKGLASMVRKFDSRVPKYQHLLEDTLSLTRQELALLSELLLRGPQTPGELRGRASRMSGFGDIDEVLGVIAGLMEREGPMVLKLPRQRGFKEQRYMHLLCGKPEIKEDEPEEEPATLRVREEEDRIARLEGELSALREELAELRRDFDELRSELK